MANPNRYRYVDFIGGRILQAREMSEIQRIQSGLNLAGTSRVAYDMDIIYREGATLNVTFGNASGVGTLTPTNGGDNMYIFVRGRWEILQTGDIDAPLTLNIGDDNTPIYLNWVLRQVTSSEDSTLIDEGTSEPAADMGELDISISITDTSGIALASNQFEKNTIPIIITTYDISGGVGVEDILSVTATGGGTGEGLIASEYISGFTRLSTNDSNGIACSNLDPRLSDTRTPAAVSINDSMVRVPVAPGGSNADGTPIYNLTSDPGGISAAKVIYVAGTQLLSDCIGWIKSQVTSILSTLSSHIGVGLGSGATHPMPTPAQVGAAPASHVGLPLGLPTSHPATVSTNSGGYVLNRVSSVTPIANDPAYGVFNSGTVTAALLHTGDIYTALSQAITISPLSPATITGPLGLLSNLAGAVAQHINQTSHANPHGLSLNDLGGSFTSVTTASVSGGIYLIIRFAPNSGSGQGAIEIAIGVGTAATGTTVPLPNVNFAYSSFIGHVSPGTVGSLTHTINQMVCNINSAGVITYTANDNNSVVQNGTANWLAIFWRINA